MQQVAKRIDWNKHPVEQVDGHLFHIVLGIDGIERFVFLRYDIRLIIFVCRGRSINIILLEFHVLLISFCQRISMGVNQRTLQVSTFIKIQFLTGIYLNAIISFFILVQSWSKVLTVTLDNLKILQHKLMIYLLS